MPVINTGLKYILLIVICMIVIGPVVTAMLGSIRTTGEFQTTPFGLPQNGIRWENYQGILQSSTFWTSLRNSIIITSGVTIINVLLSSMLAFVLTRVTFIGRGLLFNILSLGLLFPLVIAILPIFIQVRQLGLINNLLGVILPMVAFGLPGSVVILRGFFINIPGELEDAAYIDGCSTLEFFVYILLPLARPALTAVAVLQVIASWNEYFLPLLVLNDQSLWPLPLGISQFQGQYGTDWALVMAYVTLLILPAVVFYLFAEKY
ncbi:MAG: carbohydrate ABC transporter permease, partial [Anaerolineae bacterium]|nr:carbohydrate ABC transporter permease [Anaerolineae bacterium]